MNFAVESNLETLPLDLERQLEDKNVQIQLNSFPSESGETCKFYMRGVCIRGDNCPFVHVDDEKAVVCKHWLRGLCKKGDKCDFLHVYDLSKMPECFFFAKYGVCSNPDCLFLHVEMDESERACPWYARGFCKHGPRCRYRHVKKKLCPDYFEGFCPKGPKCEFTHPKWVLPKEDDRGADRGLQRTRGGDDGAAPSPRDIQQGGGGGGYGDRRGGFGGYRGGNNYRGDYRGGRGGRGSDRPFQQRGPQQNSQYSRYDQNSNNRYRPADGGGYGATGGGRGGGYSATGGDATGGDRDNSHPFIFQNSAPRGGGRGSARGGTTCYRCGEKGHFANSCPNDQRDPNFR